MYSKSEIQQPGKSLARLGLRPPPTCVTPWHGPGRPKRDGRIWHFGDRAAVVRRFHDIILERYPLILDTIQSETGKARRDALGEVISVAGTARYYLAHGSQHLSIKRRRGAVPFITSAEIVYKPHGVVGLITPWNYPFILGVADALPAFLAGNAVVIKPSELTPLSAVLARDLLIESGMDPDLFAVVHGKGDIGSELIQHVDYVGFTGGTVTGTRVAVAASQRLIPYSLELGGKNAMVVLSGTSIDDAVSGLDRWSIFQQRPDLYFHRTRIRRGRDLRNVRGSAHPSRHRS